VAEPLQPYDKILPHTVKHNMNQSRWRRLFIRTILKIKSIRTAILPIQHHYRQSLLLSSAAAAAGQQPTRKH